MLKLAVVGFGSRGKSFGRQIIKNKDLELYAIADIEENNRNDGWKEYGVPKERCFASADEFFAQGKICDAIFLCTQDKQHHQMAIKALELGYDICLEKPAGATMAECIDIRDTAQRLGRKVMLTHVLRYTPFYLYLKKLIDTGALGDVVTISQTENIAYWHFALSYVRGPWRNMEESTPTILAKCCHDLDILIWLMNKKCDAVSSFGGLYHFREENAPKGSALHCADCDENTKSKCIYNAYKVYPERMKHGVVGGTARFVHRNIFDVLDEKKDVISRCVYHCDNDAVDNQVVNMHFEDGSTAQLTMTAFSDDCYRTIKIHGTKGEAYGNLDEGVVYYTKYGEKMQKIDVSKEDNSLGIALNDGHGGGDTYLFYDFIDYITSEKPSTTRTTIERSMESHLVGFKAEESRLNGGKTMKV